MLKILPARLQQYINRELPDVQAEFRKGRRTRDQFANIHWIIRKTKEFQKNSYLCSTDCAKASDCVGHNTLWTFLERGIPDHLTCLLRSRYEDQETTESGMEQWNGSKLGKEYDKAVYCHPDYLTYMQNTSCKMLCWMNHKLESRLPGEISTTSDMQMIPL